MRLWLANNQRSFGFVALLVVLTLTVGRASYSDSEPAAMQPVNVSLPGLSSSNNIKFAANGRFVLTAPFEPSTATRFDEPLDYGELDNSRVVSLNAKNPGAAPAQLDLIDDHGYRYFYPKEVSFDPATGLLFVRATRIKSDGNESDGNEAGEFICYGPVSADGSSWKGSMVPIEIPAIGDVSEAAYMPGSFGLGRDSKVLVYTNGSEVFLVTRVEGDLYRVGPFPQGDVRLLEDYNADYNCVSRVAVDRPTNTVIVTVNTRKTDSATGTSFSSAIYFYRLNEESGPTFGTMDLIRVVSSDELSGSIPPYSDALIVGSGAFFSLDNGSICSIDLDHPGPVRVLATVPELAADPLTAGSPHLLTYDAASKTLAVIKKGQVFDVRRPAYVRRPATVRRPAYLFLQEKPACALVNVGAQGGVRVFQAEDLGPGFLSALSNAVFGQNSNLILATSDGSLLSVSAGGVVTLCAIPPLTDKLVFDPSEMTLAGVSSFNVNPARAKITTTGSILLVGAGASKGSTGVVGSLLVAPTAGLARATGSIRRPGNIVW
jgi:hypothetical protein